jgi:hypothetical protein
VFEVVITVHVSWRHNERVDVGTRAVDFEAVTAVCKDSTDSVADKYFVRGLFLARDSLDEFIADFLKTA